MPCYRCGVRQTDPERGQSPWRRGVMRDHLVLICPACQEAPDWTAELERCASCRSAHLIRRLGQVECLDCGLVREPEATRVPAAPGMSRAVAPPLPLPPLPRLTPPWPTKSAAPSTASWAGPDRRGV